MINHGQASRSHFERLVVLIVEDNRFFRSLMRTVLREFGIRHIHEAEDGADALAQIKATPPDLILLDWYMPVFSGADFMQVFNESRRPGRKSPAVIVVTANATKKNVIEAARLGVDGILCKPIVPAIIYKRILDVIDISNLADIGALRKVNTSEARGNATPSVIVEEEDDDGDDEMVFLL